MNKLLSTSAVLAALSIGTAAHAKDFYVSVFAGGSSVGTAEGSYGYSYSYGPYTLDYNVDIDVDLDNSFIAGITVGKMINPTVRVEGELSRAKYDAKKVGVHATGTFSYMGTPVYSYSYDYSFNVSGDLAATFLMANIWYGMSSFSNLHPYGGGGIGLVDINGSGDTNVSGSGLAFQLGAGVTVPIGSGMLDVGYRYKMGVDLTLEDDSGFKLEDFNLRTHNLQVGYMIPF